MTMNLGELLKKFNLGRLEPTNEEEIPATRPNGLDSADVVREIRERRVTDID